jgi:AAA15 family ATPase/GTPase
LLAEALRLGGIAVIDELDQSIHPSILLEIIRWFHDPERNPYNAQLWMSCQAASLLEDLEKEEVFFWEKSREGRTQIYGLRDIQAVRDSRMEALAKRKTYASFGSTPGTKPFCCAIYPVAKRSSRRTAAQP